MKLVELESNEEQLAFLKILTEHPSIKIDHSFYTGGIWDNGNWYWESSKKKISFPLIWFAGAPDNIGKELCLIVQKRNSQVGVKFDDIHCDVKIHVLCQRLASDII